MTSSLTRAVPTNQEVTRPDEVEPEPLPSGPGRRILVKLVLLGLVLGILWGLVVLGVNDASAGGGCGGG